MVKGFIYLLMGLVSLCFSGCMREDDGEGADLQVGDVLPEFSVVMSDGGVVSNSSLKGKVSVIIFMTISCPDCQAQFPVVEQLYQEYGSEEDFILIAISREQGEPAIGDYWREKGFTMPYSAQETRKIYNLFAKSGVPRIYISDRNCVVRKVTTDNPIATYPELKESIDALL